MIVDDGTCEVAVGLMSTFHDDFAILNDHTDRVEANHLADGIGDGFSADGGCDAEVFQIVVEETDGIVLTLLVQLAQSFAK